MGRDKTGREIRNWSLTIKLTKSVGKSLDNLAKKLGWSRASVITELILQFGEALVKKATKEDVSTQHGDGSEALGDSPPVSSEGEEL